MKIYCNNKECEYYQELKEAYHFKYHLAYIPIGNTGNYAGVCQISPCFAIDVSSTIHSIISEVICVDANTIGGKRGKCRNQGCLWNNKEKCGRKEICIDKSLTTERWICRCFSNKNIKGHMDWSRFAPGRQDGYTKF